MVLVCLPSHALSQHLPSYLGFSYLGRGVSLHRCSSKEQLLLLTLDEGYILTTTLPDLECGAAPLSPSAPMQLPLLERGVVCHQPLPLTLDMGYLLSATAPDLGHGVSPLSHCPNLGYEVAPLGRCPSGMTNTKVLVCTDMI